MLAATTAWWLVGVGLLAILAAWFYTGGSQPYGYLGLGEVMVFVFFGLVAVVGTTYVQTETFELPALFAAIGIGAYACALLVANNLRDIPTDIVAGKRTLAVVLGDETHPALLRAPDRRRRRRAGRVAMSTTWWTLLALPPARHPPGVTVVLGDKATGPDLVPVLKDTGLAELIYAAGILVGIAVSVRRLPRSEQLPGQGQHRRPSRPRRPPPPADRYQGHGPSRSSNDAEAGLRSGSRSWCRAPR